MFGLTFTGDVLELFSVMLFVLCLEIKLILRVVINDL